jgi:hypothetical protein
MKRGTTHDRSIASSRLGYVLVVLAVISLFVCTIPIWLVVLVVVLLLR